MATSNTLPKLPETYSTHRPDSVEVLTCKHGVSLFLECNDCAKATTALLRYQYGALGNPRRKRKP